MVRKLCLPEINWSVQEEACATELVKETLHRARSGTVQEALDFVTAALGFDSFVFGIVANDRRPDAESRTYVITNQADAWVRAYDERAFLELDPRVELAGEPGYAFWEARQFRKDPRHRLFLRESAAYGIESGLVIGLCTRDPPSYAMLGLNRAAPTFDQWSAEQRLLIAGQASILGKVLSRTVRRYLQQAGTALSRATDEAQSSGARDSHLCRRREDVEGDRSNVGIAKITVDMIVVAS